MATEAIATKTTATTNRNRSRLWERLPDISVGSKIEPPVLGLPMSSFGDLDSERRRSLVPQPLQNSSPLWDCFPH
jgi:hypothetical protein